MRRNRGGVAIFVAVMVCVVIGVMASIVFFHGRDSRRKGAEKRDQVQARFLARGAHNHFLLKFRLLPSELYDAVSYAVGRNPYFNFNLQMDTVTGNTFSPAPGVICDVGPMFFTGPTTNAGMVSATGGRLEIRRPSDDTIYQNAAAGFAGGADSRLRMEYFLNHFIVDIATDYPTFDGNGVIQVSSTPHQDAAQMGKSDTQFVRPRPPTRWCDPYIGQYIVRSVKILGSGAAGTATAGRRFESDSVLLTSEAYVLRDQQVSLVSRTDGKLKPLVVQRETATSIRSDSGHLELTEQRETEAQFRTRVVDTKSARRTEVLTAVYLVTRKAE